MTLAIDRRAVIRIAPPPPPAPFKPPEFRALYCWICEEDTEYRLSEDEDFYVCRICGFEVEYRINLAKPMYAIQL